MASSNLIDETEIESKYSCGICRGVLSNPCRPKDCNHLFCKDCLYNWYSQKTICPVCRKSFEFQAIVLDKTINDEINQLSTKCKICKKQLNLTEMQKHSQSCFRTQTLANQDIRRMRLQALEKNKNKDDSKQSSQINTESNDDDDGGNNHYDYDDDDDYGYNGRLHNNDSDADADAGAVGYSRPVNRYTFECPLCDEKNLTVDDLRDHCNKYHLNNRTPVVCPVCKSMPWGNPHQKSTNFLDHLNLRHKFEYDRYVDFNLNDDEAYKAAIKLSLQNDT